MFNLRLHFQRFISTPLTFRGDQTLRRVDHIVAALRPVDLIARLFERKRLLMNTFIARALHILDRLDCRSNRVRPQTSEHLLGDHAVDTQSAESDATALLVIENARGALIANDTWSWVLRRQLAATMAAAQQPREQGTAALDRSTNHGADPICIVSNDRLIALIVRPANVTLMVIMNQYRPLFAAQRLCADDALATLLDTHDRLAVPVGVRIGVNGVLQQTQHHVIACQLPDRVAGVPGAPE